eukprot:549423-Amphidinium_carterae.1
MDCKIEANRSNVASTATNQLVEDQSIMGGMAFMKSLQPCVQQCCHTQNPFTYAPFLSKRGIPQSSKH